MSTWNFLFVIRLLCICRISLLRRVYILYCVWLSCRNQRLQPTCRACYLQTFWNSLSDQIAPFLNMCCRCVGSEDIMFMHLFLKNKKTDTPPNSCGSMRKSHLKRLTLRWKHKGRGVVFPTSSLWSKKTLARERTTSPNHRSSGNHAANCRKFTAVSSREVAV